MSKESSYDLKAINLHRTDKCNQNTRVHIEQQTRPLDVCSTFRVRHRMTTSYDTQRVTEKEDSGSKYEENNLNLSHLKKI